MKLSRRQAPSPYDSQTLQLFLVGAAILYWELLLIRWLSSWIRLVAYYTNFVLIAAFFGLGVGALITRYRIRLWKIAAVLVSLCLWAGLVLSHFYHVNPRGGEYIWIGSPAGLPMTEVYSRFYLSLPLLLGILYVLVALLFMSFGQWLGRLFSGMPPVKAYAVQIAGSIAGVLGFALMSFLQLDPLAWITGGFLLLLLAAERPKSGRCLAAVCAVAVLASVWGPVRKYQWSPYYKIKVDPLTRIRDIVSGQSVDFPAPVGYQMTVNNDYHQMILDLRPHGQEYPFFTDWRWLYQLPYSLDARLPDGPILIIGAGTGNDVMAALRQTRRRIYAVDIDPAIIQIGRRLHMERPYQDPRVTVVVDDARSFMQRTPAKFALVVFGFLDSHALFSAFSSLRLDNYVYTRQSFERVKDILLPGGEVVVTFASNRPWIHERIIALLDDVFDARTQYFHFTKQAYSNGVVYRNFKGPIPFSLAPKPNASSLLPLPTDDWPYFYLERPGLPRQYRPFLTMVILLGAASLLALPKGQRQVNFPYFFMGAAFFLLETSSVVSLSLLYGSTWVVNVVVFLGILILALAGTLLAGKLESISIPGLFIALFASLAVIYYVPVASLLLVGSMVLRVAASMIFLGPTFFAGFIFAGILRQEGNLIQAYGSNLLGAVIGGACEYQSLSFGFHYLLNLIVLFYLLSFWFIYRSQLHRA